jgi:hypothetical protein
MFHVSHNRGDVYIHGAAMGAAATSCAEPWELGFNDFVHHTQGYHADYFSRVPTLHAGIPSNWATVAACSAGQTEIQIELGEILFEWIRKSFGLNSLHQFLLSDENPSFFRALDLTSYIAH